MEALEPREVIDGSSRSRALSASMSSRTPPGAAARVRTTRLAPSGRRHGDDRAPTAFHHPRHKGAQGEEGPGEVRLHDLTPVRVGCFHQGPRPTVATGKGE